MNYVGITVLILMWMMDRMNAGRAVVLCGMEQYNGAVRSGAVLNIGVGRCSV